MPHRSPQYFALLLIATIYVDMMAIVWLYSERFSPPAATFYLSLAYAHVSILCVWTLVLRSRARLRWLAPFVAGLIIAAIVTYSARRDSGHRPAELLFVFTALMWLHVALIAPVLWLLLPTRLVANYSGRTPERPWQFSLLHLLALMTGVPILIVVVSNAKPLFSDISKLVSFPMANALLLFGALAAQSASRFWPFRLAASIAFALGLAAIAEWTQLALADETSSFAFFVIQIIVIWAWLEVLRPRPAAGVNAGDPSPVAERQTQTPEVP
jgi:hypothetical protein